MIQTIPNDPIMLLSFINTQLRDHYQNLTELCKAYMIEENFILDKLGNVDYYYDQNRNQFL